jgi:zinc transport system permease protein
MLEALQFEFMRNALAAGLLASLICGIMGSLVVVNRIVFLSGGIAHAAYGGIGLSFFMGWPYIVGTMGFALAAALAMGAVTLKARHRADTVIGVMWAVGMAVGIVLLDLTPGYQADLMSYLFGSILTVPGSDLWLMAAVGLVILVVTLLFYNAFLAMAFDEEFARVRGIPVRLLYLSFIGLLAVSIVLIIQVVGLILVIALLTIPPFIAEKFSRSLGRMMVLSCLLSALFTICGLLFSYYFDLTAGACIILAAAAGFCFSILLERISMRRSAAVHSTGAALEEK